MGTDPVPKSEQLILREVPSDEPNAVSLRRAREMYGGQATLTNPLTRVQQSFSLDAWSDRDPDTTFLLIGVRFIDPGKVGTFRRE